jgi:hypothetical protein
MNMAADTGLLLEINMIIFTTSTADTRLAHHAIDLSICDIDKNEKLPS